MTGSAPSQAHGVTSTPAREDQAPAVRAAASPWAVLVVMCTGYFLVLLDVTIVNVALPRIGAGLGAGVSGLQWVVDGYALALASLMLAGGTVGDLPSTTPPGRRPVRSGSRWPAPSPGSRPRVGPLPPAPGS
jgi:hypothetical protein